MRLCPHPDAGEPEPPQVSARPAVHAVTVTHSGRARVAGLTPQLVHSRVPFRPRGGRQLLESCLLTDAEYAAGREAWQRLPTAFDSLLDPVA